MLYSRFLLVIYFIYSSVYIPQSLGKKLPRACPLPSFRNQSPGSSSAFLLLLLTQHSLPNTAFPGPASSEPCALQGGPSVQSLLPVRPLGRVALELPFSPLPPGIPRREKAEWGGTGVIRACSTSLSSGLDVCVLAQS